jgi:hypothetical protein
MKVTSGLEKGFQHVIPTIYGDSCVEKDLDRLDLFMLDAAAAA